MLRMIQAVLAVASVATSAMADGPAEDAPHVVGEAGERIARYVERVAANGFSGTVLAAIDGKVIAAVSTGFADLEGTTPLTPATLFEIASASKQFTAAAVMRLVQDGRLRLDDPIAKHLPQGSIPENCRGITIEHLLRHTSGIPGSNSQGGGDDIEAVLPSFLRGGPRHEPGTHWEYWNQGYAILSEIINRASGEDFTEFSKRALFRPAEMKSTCFTGDESPDGTTVAVGRSSRGAPRSALDHPYGSFGFQYRGMGGVVSSAWDLWRWDRALRADEILSTQSKEQLFKPGLRSYALGWFVRRDRHGRLVQSHGGGVRGFICEMRRYPEQDAFLVVLCNRDDAPLREVVQTVEAMLFGDAGEPDDGAELANLDGRYESERGPVLIIKSAGGISRAAIHWSGVGRQPVTNATLLREGEQIILDDGSDRIPIQVLGDAGKPPSAIDILGDVYHRVVAEDRLEAQEKRSELPIDPGMNVMIATKPYEFNEHGTAHLPAGVTWRVLPRYVGMSAGGQRTVDDRITLVLQDAENGFWPVIARMDIDVAERLVAELQNLIEERTDR